MELPTAAKMRTNFFYKRPIQFSITAKSQKS